MVTTAMLVISLAVLLVSLVQSSILNRIVSDRTLAITHAQYVLEAIRNAAASESYTAAHNGIRDYRWDFDSAELASQGLTALSNETIETRHNHPVYGIPDPNNIANVTVTVNWDERRVGATTVPSNITLETLIGNPAP